MAKSKHAKNNKAKKNYGKKPKNKKHKNKAPSKGSYSGGGGSFYYEGMEFGESDFQVAEPLGMLDDDEESK